MSNKLHIAHILYRFDTGGLENGVVNLINRLGEKDFSHTIITLNGHSPTFVQRIKTNNVEFFNLAKKPGQDWGVYLRLNAFLRALSPDILHTRNFSALEYQVVGWWRRIPLRIHGEHGWDVNDLHGSNKKFQVIRKIMRVFVQQYVALSIEAKEYLLRTIHVKPNKVHHICNGVDTLKFSNHHFEIQDLPTEVREWTRTNKVIFGTVGRLEEVKNQQYLIDAFIQLLKVNPQLAGIAKLIIVGEGSFRPLLEKMVDEAGIASSVWFSGNRSDVPALMSLMDVFVLPSLAEGISNTIIEAMASGLPVVATNVGGNSDLMLPDFKDSHLVSVDDVKALTTKLKYYADDINKVLVDSVVFRNYCQDHFSLDTMVEKYHQLYQSN